MHHRDKEPRTKRTRAVSGNRSPSRKPLTPRVRSVRGSTDFSRRYRETPFRGLPRTQHEFSRRSRSSQNSPARAARIGGARGAAGVPQGGGDSLGNGGSARRGQDQMRGQAGNAVRQTADRGHHHRRAGRQRLDHDQAKTFEGDGRNHAQVGRRVRQRQVRIRDEADEPDVVAQSMTLDPLLSKADNLPRPAMRNSTSGVCLRTSAAASIESSRPMRCTSRRTVSTIGRSAGQPSFPRSARLTPVRKRAVSRPGGMRRISDSQMP